MNTQPSMPCHLPRRALHAGLAATLLAGLAGSLVGYELGHYAYEWVAPMLPEPIERKSSVPASLVSTSPNGIEPSK